MIIPRKFYVDHSWLSFVIRLIVSIGSFFKINYKKKETETIEKIGYPNLVKHNGKVTCSSCGICEVSCPTQAIELSFSNKIDLSSNPFEGRPPAKFEVKIQECIQCFECVNICPVDALELNGGYSTDEKIQLS